KDAVDKSIRRECVRGDTGRDTCHGTVDTPRHEERTRRRTPMDASAVHAGNVLELVREHRAPASGPPLTLHPAIAGSWRRCALDYALDPGRRTYSPTVIDAAAL